MARKIWVDAGHGGRDPGADAGGVKEKHLTLHYASDLADELTRRGLVVGETRTTDADLAPEEKNWKRGKSIDMRRRTDRSNAFGADAFVSIHANAGASASTNGAWVLYAKGSKQGQRLAAAIFKELAKIAGITDADPEAEVYSDGTGWTGGRTLHVLRKTHAPAVIVETGFLTNAADRLDLQQDSVRQRVVRAIADGISAWLG